MFTATDGGALGEESSEAIFGTLYAQPMDNLTIKFRGYYQEDEDGPPANALLKFTGDDQDKDTCTGTTRSGFDADGNPVTLEPTNFWCGNIPKRGSSMAPRVDSNTSLRPQHRAFVGQEDLLIETLIRGSRQIDGIPNLRSLGIKREIKRFSLTGEYLFANGITVSSTAAYNENDAAHVRDFDLSPIEAWWISNPQSGEDWSFDLTVASDQDTRLR